MRMEQYRCSWGPTFVHSWNGARSSCSIKATLVPAHRSLRGVDGETVRTFLTEGSRTRCTFELGRATSFSYGTRNNGTGKVYKGMWITPVAKAP